MTAFLDEVTDYLFSQHSVQALSSMVLVVPSRRSAYFLQQSIAMKVREVMRAPRILAMDDFMQEVSGTDRADNLELLFDLFETFRTLHPALSLAKFMGWGPVLLKDYDLIDQYAVQDADAFFEYLTEAKSLERWGVQPGEAASQVQQNYFSLYQQITAAFPLFREKLLAKRRVYRGLAYRLAQEKVKEMPEQATPYTFHYFIGLNALSRTEETIIHEFLEANLADALWDTDTLYMQGNHRAGVFLRKHQKQLMRGKTWRWTQDHLRQNTRSVHFIPVTAAVWQAQLAAQRYSIRKTEGVRNATGWILNDESLLPALLQSLPPEVGSVNITMGLSLRQSQVYSFLTSVFDLQLHHKSIQKGSSTVVIPTFTPALVKKVYQHPLYILFRQVIGISSDRWEQYSSHNPFIKPQELLDLMADDAMGQLVFARWPSSPLALGQIKEVLQTLRKALVGESQVMEVEFLFTLLTLCQRLEKLVPTSLDVSLGMIRQLFQDLVRQERVPFAGEPVAELQIMSMLETRCLDFDKVVIFHANEGFLPSAKKVDSLIPFDLAREYGLPIYSDQDSVMAYHFFRLLQRAREADIYYVLPAGKGLGGGKEPSRFLRQLEQMDMPQTQWATYSPQKIEDEWENSDMIPWKKTEALLPVLMKWLSETGFSPTSLDTWLRCERKFLMKHVWKWKEVEEEQDTLGADVYGQLIHSIMEAFFKLYPIQNAQTAAQFQAELPEVLQHILQTSPFSQFDFQGGYHALIKKIALEQLNKYLVHLQNENLALEVERMEFPLEFVWTSDQGLPVRWKARVDQQEKVEGKTYLIDFKTGKAEGGNLTQGLFSKIRQPKEGKIRQLWMYQYLMMMQEGRTDVVAKIVSFRNLSINPQLSPVEVGLGPDEFRRESHLFMQEVISHMLDVGAEILSTTVPDDCKICGFRLACGKDSFKK